MSLLTDTKIRRGAEHTADRTQKCVKRSSRHLSASICGLTKTKTTLDFKSKAPKQTTIRTADPKLPTPPLLTIS
jgi:hypothetical protein